MTSVSVTNREELLRQFYQCQKDRRELKRRNLQAQTNIAQYFRKHKLNPFPADKKAGGGGGGGDDDALNGEYSRMLGGIEGLAAIKQQEGRE